MKKVIFLMALGFLLQVTPTKAGTTVLGSGGSAVALGFLSAVGIDPLGLGLGGSSSTPSTATPKDQSSIKTQFETLAALPGSFDLLNQSAGSSLNTLEILK